MNDNTAPHYTELPIAQLEENKGQIDGLPATPRNIQPDKLAKLKRSILDNPEMLQLRGILVYPHGDKYIVIGGNMRLRAENKGYPRGCFAFPQRLCHFRDNLYRQINVTISATWVKQKFHMGRN